MLFTNPVFYLFVLTVFLIVRWTPTSVSRWILVVASYCFYGTVEPWYCLILFTSTLVDFWVAPKIAAANQMPEKKCWLGVSLLVNLGLLVIFKYANFTTENLNLVLGMMNMTPFPKLDLILPIGISFYTFQTLAYTIDVYRGKQTPTKDFASFCLFVAFFPQLVAGPIERARNLLDQLRGEFRATREDIEYGIQRILWGVAKKVFFADRFAIVVSQVFGQPDRYSSPELILATFCFSFQLYLDFSAYTDIAIGLARLFGIRLTENFNYPFLARNPSDFWSRWHITLTNWFRDYLYTALGGTRRSNMLATVSAVLIVMSVMGLWHGPQWHFVVFGLLSGIMVVVYMGLRLFLKRKRLLGDYWWSTVLSIVIMNIVINLIMIFFRAPTVTDALHIINRIINAGGGFDDKFILPLVMLLIVAAAHLCFGSLKERIHDYSLAPIVRGALWAVIIMLINLAAVSRTEKFIYFQF